MAMPAVGTLGSFLLFVVLPGTALAAAIAFSGYEVYRIGERKLLLVIVILALMFQHQVLEAATFVGTGESVGEGFGEVFETSANLVASGSVYYVLRFARRERRLVDELERHRRRFQLIAEHIDEIIYLATRDFSEILYINPAYEDIYGRPVESLYENPRSFVEVAHPDDRARYDDDIQQLVADIEAGTHRDSYEGEYRLLIDDEVRWVRVRRFPVENDDGSVDRIVGQVRDITERRRLRQAYRDVFENVSDGLVVHEPESGEMVEVNERFCEMTGYGREELVGETVDLVSADADEYSYERARQLIQRARDEGPQLFEWREKRKNGETYPVEIHLSLVELRGRERVLASVRDITERKRREREYEQIFNGVEDAINIIDPETLEIRDANDAYLDLLGYDDLEAIRKEGVEGLSLTDEGFTPEAGRAIHQRVAESGDPEVVEWQAETADGRRLWLEVKVTPAVINGEQLNIVIHRNITERKRREQRLEVFNRILRHNLRNQLEVVKSHAERLADRTDDDHAERIIASADRLAVMGERARRIDQCLSRELQETRVDLAAALRESLGTVGDAEAVDVVTELPSDASVTTDEELLDTILDGVLENAVTYADSSVTVTLERNPDEYVLVVADDGPGIPDDQLASIEAGEETAHQHGRGLGLWQIKWGVEKLNGTLSFDTDDGTTVRITLPDHGRVVAG